MYKYSEALEASLEYFNGNDLSAKVFVDKYALKNPAGELTEKTPRDMHVRIAKEIAKVEKNKFKNPLSFETIFGYLDKFKKIIPQGSILYGCGNPYQYVTLSNCYVLNPPEDSYGGIHYTDQQLTQISKRRGGCGIDISNLRPNEAPTKNSSRTSTGIIPFMERYSNSIREVGQNGRRGALMITISVHHPQILDFAKVKLDTQKVTGANISIRLSNEFLKAVENNEQYEQRWPVDSEMPEYSKMVSAKDVWNEIILCAHTMAEPGLLFWDNIIEESVADCYSDYGFKTVSTNPCSELPLSILDSCRLLLLNLFAYVNSPFTDNASFDWIQFAADTQIAQRLLDDIIDIEISHLEKIINKIENDPEPDYIKANELALWENILKTCREGRRTGLGITALGDTLAALGIKYSDRLDLVDELYSCLKINSYRSSVEMAKELGPFEHWDWELEKDNPFIARIGQENPSLYEDIKRFGRRNIANLTTAPAGTVSLLAAIGEEYGTTSGIEPAFMLDYLRRKKINPTDKHAKVSFVDPSGDSWEEFTVYHPGVKEWMRITGKTDIKESPYYGACANDINWEKRVQLQSVAQKHIDHAISSTINLPATVSVDEVKKIYEAAWKMGCKGITVYRDGCRTGVLVSNKETPKKTEDRPKEVPCDVYHISVKGKEYFVLVGIINDQPYEVFAGKNGFLKKKIKSGAIKKIRGGLYKATFEDDTELVPLTSMCDADEEAITRLTSVALRNGTDIHEIVVQLEKINGDMTSFAKSIARALKKYIPDGTEEKSACPECSGKVIRSSGCVSCQSCGWSKCT